MTGLIHKDAATCVKFSCSLTDILDHLLPGIGVIVRTIDARHVHALPDQVVYQGIVSGGLTGQGHHDASRARMSGFSQDQVGIVRQNLKAFTESGIGEFGLYVERIPQRPAEHVNDILEIGKHMRFALPSDDRPASASLSCSGRRSSSRRARYWARLTILLVKVLSESV